MQKRKIINLSHELNGRLLLHYCESFWCKLRGLAWQRNLGKDEGIVMVYKGASISGAAIHMFGMFFDLAIIWLNEEMKIVDLRIANKWHPLFAPKEAAMYVIECSVLRAKEFKIGDQLAFEEI